MARNREQNRHCNHVIRIICEGEKTEPLFFTALCERYVTTKGIDARTVPQAPVTDETEELSTERGSYKGKKRQVKQLPAEDAPVISGAPPLKWVVYARRLRAEGVDEAGAVYDKDKHPKHKEAIEEAEKIVNGKRVGIAFTSRSFEYYLLLHFEYLYREFQETESAAKRRFSDVAPTHSPTRTVMATNVSMDMPECKDIGKNQKRRNPCSRWLRIV